jgi:hypothetical protein
VRTASIIRETSVDNHFTRQYNPEDSSEHHTRRRENLKSHIGEDIVREYEIKMRNTIQKKARMIKKMRRKKKNQRC